MDVDTPTVIPGVQGVAKLSCGGLHTLAARQGAGSGVVAWGANQNGELGLGAGVNLDSRHPAAVKGLESAETISAGWKHSAAVTGNGRLFTWGWGGSQGG